MRLTRATEYAYRAMRYLGTCREDRWYSIQEIAAAEEMPVQFLAKVMQHLTQAGLVLSACGKTGGYRLARPPEEILMADVFLAMEGPLSVNTCLMYPSECKFRQQCKVHGVWEELQQAILGVLGRHTLAEILPDTPYGTVGRKRMARRRAFPRLVAKA